MKKTNNIKKRIIATVLSAITVLLIGALAVGSASALARSYPHEHYRGKAFNNVRVVDDTTAANGKVAFFWP